AYRAWADSAYQTYCQLTSGNDTLDIVEYPDCGGEGFELSRLASQATVCRLHTPWTAVRKFNEITEGPLDRLLLCRLEKGAIRKAGSLSAPSNAVAALVNKMWGIKKVTVFPNPMPRREYPQSQGSAWIFTGRVERRKGVHLLLQAYGKLCGQENLPPLKLVGAPYGIYNGAPYGDYIGAMIDRLQMSGRVTWIKGVAHEEIFDHLIGSAVAVFPSAWENYPYSCLEAMACGCAVVAPRCGGFPEIIQDLKTGLLFEAGSVEDLTEKLLTLLRRPHLQSELGVHARSAVAALCDAETIGKCTEDFYYACIAGRKNL
ncbi:MAG: glycosyltransferase family 4 protein, partial [Chitinivibrionales bacterium]|nr:glycosyltransferase family 4 protein [Chitinivibrionales bacterium]